MAASAAESSRLSATAKVEVQRLGLPRAFLVHQFRQRVQPSRPFVQSAEGRERAAFRRHIQSDSLARCVAPQNRFELAGGAIAERASAAENHRSASFLDILIQQVDRGGRSVSR